MRSNFSLGILWGVGRDRAAFVIRDWVRVRISVGGGMGRRSAVRHDICVRYAPEGYRWAGCAVQVADEEGVLRGITQCNCSGIFPKQHFYHNRKRCEIVLARLPDDCWTYLEIPVHHLVPHSRKFFPRNLRVVIDNLLGDFLDRFPDHDKVENDRITCFPVIEQLLVRHACRIGLDRRYCVINIREVEFHFPFRHR